MWNEFAMPDIASAQLATTEVQGGDYVGVIQDLDRSDMGFVYLLGQEILSIL